MISSDTHFIIKLTSVWNGLSFTAFQYSLGLNPNMLTVASTPVSHSHIHTEKCPFCAEARYSPSCKPHQISSYLPLIPQLQVFFQNAKAVELLLYCYQYLSTPGSVSDIFDGEWYHILRNMLVTINRVAYSHHYFNHWYDIMLGVTADSYLLFKHCCGGPSVSRTSE